MTRCIRKWELEVHHKRRDGGNSLDNAQVLCQTCHERSYSYGVSGQTPPNFSEETKQKALLRAGNRCECISTGGCH